jgi:hypothetical protein
MGSVLSGLFGLGFAVKTAQGARKFQMEFLAQAVKLM